MDCANTFKNYSNAFNKENGKEFLKGVGIPVAVGAGVGLIAPAVGAAAYFAGADSAACASLAMDMVIVPAATFYTAAVQMGLVTERLPDGSKKVPTNARAAGAAVPLLALAGAFSYLFCTNLGSHYDRPKAVHVAKADKSATPPATDPRIHYRR